MQKTVLAPPGEGVGIERIWRILVLGKRWVLGVPVLAMIGAAFTVMFIEPQWEASAAIQIGAVGTDQGKQIVEPVPRVLARMKLEAFEDAVLAGLKVPLNGDPRAKLYRRSLKFKALPNTDLIEIRVRGYSPRQAQRFIEGTVDYLHRVHKAMAAPSIERMKQLLIQVDRELATMRMEREKALRLANLQQEAFRGNKFSESIVRDNILVQRDKELRTLEQTKAGFKEQLDPMRTYPTSYIENISVSENPVAPKKALIVFLAGLLGLFFGVMAAFTGNRLTSA